MLLNIDLEIWPLPAELPCYVLNSWLEAYLSWWWSYIKVKVVTKIIRNQTVVITAASACPDFNALEDSGPLRGVREHCPKKYLIQSTRPLNPTLCRLSVSIWGAGFAGPHWFNWQFIVIRTWWCSFSKCRLNKQMTHNECVKQWIEQNTDTLKLIQGNIDCFCTAILYF